MITLPEFYVYAYLDIRKPVECYYAGFFFRYEPFYIGKGKKRRSIVHLFDYSLEKDKNRHKVHKIERIRKDTGKDPAVIIIKKGLTEASAFDLEKMLISIIGRKDIGKGPLTNRDDGGEGKSGYRHKESTKDIIRLKNTGRIKTANEIAKIKESKLKIIGKSHFVIYGENSDSIKNKIRVKLLGRRLSQETVNKMREYSWYYNSGTNSEIKLRKTDSIPDGYRAGRKSLTIMARTKMSIAKKNKPSNRKGKLSKSKYPRGTISKIIELKNIGYGYRRISKVVGVARNMCRYLYIREQKAKYAHNN